MQVYELLSVLERLRDTDSDNTAEAIVRETYESHGVDPICFFSDTKYDNIGVGPKTVQSVLSDLLGSFEYDSTISERLHEMDGVVTAQTTLSSNHSTVSELRSDIEALAERSGNCQKQYMKTMFEKYYRPSIVSHACLNDWPTDVSDTTIANAIGVRDSMPFYDSVISVLEDDDRFTAPRPGRAFSPMLAVSESRGRPENPVAQRKIDGYRILIHVLEDGVQAHSRRLNDITPSLPELESIEWPDGEYIFDGEVVAQNGSYSATSERIGRKQENVPDDPDIEMRFELFDLVVSERTESIWTERFMQRHSELSDLVAQIDDRRVTAVPVDADIERAKDRAVQANSEGIIVKNSESTYEFGDRSKHWQKVKLDDETIDVRISGLVEGTGESAGTLGSIEIESDDGVHLGNCGTGFTDDEADTIWNNQDTWIEKTIEVEARGIGSNGHLRMPVYIRDRSDDGTADSMDRIQSIMKDI